MRENMNMKAKGKNRTETQILTPATGVAPAFAKATAWHERSRKIQKRARVAATLKAIKNARGMFKRAPGEKPMSEWWPEYKKEEKALEDARFERLMYSGCSVQTESVSGRKVLK